MCSHVPLSMSHFLEFCHMIPPVLHSSSFSSFKERDSEREITPPPLWIYSLSMFCSSKPSQAHAHLHPMEALFRRISIMRQHCSTLNSGFSSPFFSCTFRSCLSLTVWMTATIITLCRTSIGSRR